MADETTYPPYARTNDAGMFATTGRAERAAAPIR